MGKKTKKKLIISTYDDKENPYYAGGGSCSIHEIAKRLVSEYEVTVFTANYSGATNKVIDGVKYKRIGFSFVGPKFGQLLWHITLPFLIILSDFDIWVESFTPPFSTSFLPLFTEKPVVGLVHMLAAADMERKYKLPFSLIENVGLKSYKHIIVLTKNSKKKIIKVNRNVNIYVIANGVDLPTTKKDRKEEHILYLGRVELDQKGIDMLLRAFGSISGQVGKPLLIAGSGTEKEVCLLREMIKDYKLKECVKYVGKVEGQMKKEVFEKAAFLVLPSRYETFSMVSLEAFSYGLPVLCFDIEGLSWFDSRSAIKVKPFDEISFAEQILKLQKDRRKRLAMGSRGRELAKRYSWEEIAKKYKTVLNRIVDLDMLGSQVRKKSLLFKDKIV